MKLTVSYNEILAYVKANYHVTPGLNPVDGHTLDVSYSPMKFLPEIKMRLHVEKVEEDSVMFTYESTPGSMMLINGVLGFLQEKMNKEGVEIDTRVRTVCFRLSGIDRVKDVCRFVALDDLSFETDLIQASVRLK